MSKIWAGAALGLGLVAALALSNAALAGNGLSSPTMDTVRQRGQLICGVDTGAVGFAYQDSGGEWRGLDVAYCRAIADALLGSPTKVKFIGLTSAVRFSVLASGEIDVLIRDTEQTFVRNTQVGLDEPTFNFYTAQTFMVRKSLDVLRAKDLSGATICVLTGTTLESNIADYNRANDIKINTLLFDKPEDALAATEARRCDGYSDDRASLAAARSIMKEPGDWMIIPETIGGLQPLGPFTRLGDQSWSRLVRWVHNAMIEGELLGVTRDNVDQTRASTKDPETRRYLGLEGNFGEFLGVDNAWAYRIAKDIGNYSEIYDAYFGSKGLGLPRGMNDLYNKGGLFVTPSWK